MTVDDLKEEIAIELEFMETVVHELLSLKNELEHREPTVREKTAAGAFLAQFYSGIENILKRINTYYSCSLPAGDTWHTDLFLRYCDPPYGNLPLLFDKSLAQSIGPYRKFRHVVHHGYGFQLEWGRLREGIEGLQTILERFRHAVMTFLESLSAEEH